MIGQPLYLESVQSRAQRQWENLESDPELAAPWWHLFRQVQSPRHVLSELLQNADDVGATEASASVIDHCFVFRHNGCDFSGEDFASLCRFGWSNKRVMHTIGFRGIGFKSLFSLGDVVWLRTPTLSVAFDRKRFTLPYWIDAELPEDGRTEIRVQMTDEACEMELFKSIHEWAENPVSLLFFSNIRCLRMDGRESRWEKLGEGPARNSEWVGFNGEAGQKRLLAWTEAEPFGAEALGEIRQERMVRSEELPDFPPCQVKIVMGGKGLLYNVLPVGLKTRLPFDCNAPFIQDPARLRIKDPALSSTNRWLLERVGRLAASVMIEWLGNKNLTPSERAKAYALLPDIAGDGTSLECIVATRVRKFFNDALAGVPCVLADTGDVRPVGNMVALPHELYDVWDLHGVAQLLHVDCSSLFSRHVSERDRGRILDWNLAKPIERERIIESVKWHTVPKPATWDRLLNLWAYVRPRDYGERQGISHLRIVPVATDSNLGACTDAVRVKEKISALTDDDSQFVRSLVRSIDPEWLTFLEEGFEAASGEKDPGLPERLNAAREVYDNLRLAEATDISKVLEQAASTLNTKRNAEVGDWVRLAHIAARLNTRVGRWFRFITCDGHLRTMDENVVFDLDGTTEDLLPEAVRSRYLLDGRYFNSYRSCDAREWKEWITSGRSGIYSWMPPIGKSRWVHGHSKVEAELQRRGMREYIHRRYFTDEYVIHDRDFDDSLWRYWQDLAAYDPRVWGKVMGKILSQPASFWEPVLKAEVCERARNGKEHKVTDALVPAAWVVKFRELPCLPDRQGILQRPNELLRVTKDTEALEGVEPFVGGGYDQKETSQLLNLLGVRDRPAGPEHILRYLRSLASVEKAPAIEVEKWYGRLDEVFGSLSTADQQMVRKAFGEERLIMVEGGGWASSGSVFVTRNDDEAPGAPVVRSSVRELALWTRVGVTERPTAETAMRWLRQLPAGEKLSDETIDRTRVLLRRHPQRVWHECGHWLNSAGRWVEVTGLRWAISGRSAMESRNLFDCVMEKTGDFRMLSEDVVGKPPFSVLPTLASAVEEHAEAESRRLSVRENWAWLSLVGSLLSRMEMEDSSEQERVRALGARLAETSVWSTATLHIIPYVGGKPAGTRREVPVAWVGLELYVLDTLTRSHLARLVPEYLASAFDRNGIAAALSYCYERPNPHIEAYFEENFRLSRIEVDNQGQPDGETAGDLAGQPGIPPWPLGTPGPDSLPEPQPPIDPGSSGEQGPSGPGGNTNTDSDPNEPVSPRRPEKPLMERFALSQGFQGRVDGRFAHTDGRVIGRTHGEVFPWAEWTRQGDLVCCYYPKEHCLESKPMELAAELWDLLESSPERYALILVDVHGQPMRAPGQLLRDFRQADKLKLYPASYRLVIT